MGNLANPITKVLTLIKALMMGYTYTTSSGYRLGLDENGVSYFEGTDIEGNDVILSGMGAISFSYLVGEAKKMSEEKYFEVCTFISLNKDKIEVEDDRNDVQNV